MNLVAFVGRKISLEPFEPKLPEGSFLMDSAFMAEYEVLEVVRGTYTDKFISFEVYDHHGYPPFAEHDTVLLFVSRDKDGTFYHQKYQFFAVYPTALGSWAGCGDPYARESSVHHGPIEAHPIDFNPPLIFNLLGLTKKQIDDWYSPEYFRFGDDEVECKNGNTIDELLRVKFEGVLGARGFRDIH